MRLGAGISSIGPVAASGDKAREADLSTKQAGAQAPPRLPCPHGNQRWPQGGCSKTHARAQAAQRLSRARRPASSHAASQTTRGFSGRRNRRQGSRDRLRVAGASEARWRTGAGRFHRIEKDRDRRRTKSRPAPPARDRTAVGADWNEAGARLCIDRAAGSTGAAVRSDDRGIRPRARECTRAPAGHEPLSLFKTSLVALKSAETLVQGASRASR